MSDLFCRDPNSVESLDVFDQSVQWAVDGSFTDKDVDEAKLSVFSQVPPFRFLVISVDLNALLQQVSLFSD